LTLLGVPPPGICNQNTVGEMAIFNLYTRKYSANDN